MSAPIKRKITLELASKKTTLIKDRPSVFQRLGTKRIGRAGGSSQQHQQHQQYHGQEAGESKEEIVKRIVSAAEESAPAPSSTVNVPESVAAHARLIQAQLAAKAQAKAASAIQHQQQQQHPGGNVPSHGEHLSATVSSSSAAVVDKEGIEEGSLKQYYHPHHSHHHHHHHHHHHQHHAQQQEEQQRHRQPRSPPHSVSSERSSSNAAGASGWDQSSLENADQAILERKRKELQHELKLEMDATSSGKKKDARLEMNKKMKKMVSGGSHRSSGQQQHLHHAHSMQHGGHGGSHQQMGGRGQQHTSTSTSESSNSSSGTDSTESDSSSTSSSSSHNSNHRRLKKRHAVSARVRRNDSSSSSEPAPSAMAASSKLSKRHAKKLAAAAAAHEQERSKRLLAKASKSGAGGGSGGGTVLLTKTIRVKKLAASPGGSTHHVSRKVSSRDLSPASAKVAASKYALKASSSSSSKKEKMSAIDARERVREKERELALREKEREREKERLRLRERERERERERLKMRPISPRSMRSGGVSPVSSRGGGSVGGGGGVPMRELQGKGKKSPERRLSSPMGAMGATARYRDMVPMRRERTPEMTRSDERRRHELLKERERRERADRERAERERELLLREKEREEALVRERQRERDRLLAVGKEQQQQQQQQQAHLQAQARGLRGRDNDGGLEKPDRHRPVERLLPRPAERARALAAARSPGKSVDRDRSRSPCSPGTSRGSRGAMRERDRSYERATYLHELHERRTASRSREREYGGSLVSPPMRSGRRDSPPPPHYDRHGGLGRGETSGVGGGGGGGGSGGGGREYRTVDRGELAYDERLAMGSGGRGGGGGGGGVDRGPGRDEYVRDYPDDPPPRRDGPPSHHDRGGWGDCERVERSSRYEPPGDRRGEWGDRGDQHGSMVNLDGPYPRGGEGGGGGGGGGGESRGSRAWDERPSWKDGPAGDSWHGSDKPDRGMVHGGGGGGGGGDWKYKERQWEHEHPERGGNGPSGAGHVGGGHGGPPAGRRSWQAPPNGNGGPSGGGAPPGEWHAGPKADHEREFMHHQRPGGPPNERAMFRRHHHQGPYHGHPRKPHLGIGGGGGAGGGVGAGGNMGPGGPAMNRFTPNKYSLNRTQANLQAERQAAAAAHGMMPNQSPNQQQQPQHVHGHRQTPPVGGGGPSMPHPGPNQSQNQQQPQHHGMHPMQNQRPHEPHLHGEQQQQMQQQQQQPPHHHHPHHHPPAHHQQQHQGGVMQHAHPQPQQPSQPHRIPPGNYPEAEPTKQQHQLPPQPVTVQRRTVLDEPASPAPEDAGPTVPIAAVPNEPPTPQDTAAAVPIATAAAVVVTGPTVVAVGTTPASPAAEETGAGGIDAATAEAQDAMEVDNLSEISDDPDDILTRDEEINEQQQRRTPPVGMLEARSSLISTANGTQPLEYRRPPFLSKARYKSYEDAIVGGLKPSCLSSPDISANQLCDSISTDRSGSSQQVDLIGQEADGGELQAAAGKVIQQPAAMMPKVGDPLPGTMPVPLGGAGQPALAVPAGVAAPLKHEPTAGGVSGLMQPEQATKDAGKLNANKELKEEMDLDFEEISDGELEAEESSRCRGLGDPLGVDWGSLAQEALRPLKPTTQLEQQFPVSARNRWKAHHILLDIGISARLAGQNYAQRVMTESKEKLREELEEFRAASVAGKAAAAAAMQDEKKHLPAKKEREEEEEGVDRKEDGGTLAGAPDSGATGMEGTGQEDGSKDVKPPVQHRAVEQEQSVSSIERDLEEVDRILHPVAAVHVAMRERARLRRNLILATEPVPGQRHHCGRALSARRDLQIRRQLCGFPPTTLATMASCAAGAAAGYLNQELQADAPLGGGGGTTSPDLHEAIAQMFRQMVEQRKQQESQGISTTLRAV